jgi:CspA family cold shock protein
MQDGIVKFYNAARGYGFIQPTNGSTDVFVHASALERAGLGPLAEGDKVSFDTEVDRRNGKTCVGNIQMA